MSEANSLLSVLLLFAQPHFGLWLQIFVLYYHRLLVCDELYHRRYEVVRYAQSSNFTDDCNITIMDYKVHY